MTRERRTLIWLGLALFLCLVVWLLRSILLPFVLGMAIAYFLDPLADRLERRGVPRSIAAVLMLISFFGIAILLLLLILPTVVEQVTALAQALPVYFSTAIESVRPMARRVMKQINTGSASDLSQPLALAQSAAGFVGQLLNAALERGLALANSLVLLALTPLVAFYLLRDWDTMVDVVDGWLPLDQAETIRDQLREMDAVLAGFARGTALVCLFLGAFYGISLSLIGLNFGLTIGLIAGMVSFIPYFGAFFGLVTSVGVALFQFWPDYVLIALTAGIFFAGQLLYDYVLTPRLVGDRVNLHPLWVMFGLFAGGVLFGFVGLLLAVPLCAMIGVLTRFAVVKYKESELYLGTED